MSVISKKNSVLGTPSGALLLFFVTLLSLAQRHVVYGTIVLTVEEAVCLENTGELFQNAGVELFTAKNEFQVAMDMKMTSAQKMFAEYPEDRLSTYEGFCRKYGGKMHIIKMDFFDCVLRSNPDLDVELTLKKFANCMAYVPECENFNQEHILEEAWSEMGLNCRLEENETKKDPADGKDKIDDDIAKKEKEAAAAGTDEADKEEKENEYVPEGKDGTRKKKGRFVKFVLFLSVCGAGYFVFDRHRQGNPIELPYAISSRLPFGGASESRFSRRPQSAFVSDYNLIGGEENTLQFSTELP